MANCEKFKAAGIDCLTTGTKALWPGAGIFDYLSLRTNGYEWHMDLTAGKISWTDPKVKDVFAQLGKLQPYRHREPCGDRLAGCGGDLLVQGKAANYVMGNFAVGVFKEGGMTNDNLGFMVFPEITPGIPRAEEAPTDTIHIPAGAKNVEDAKKFLAYVATADAQTKWNTAVGQLPTNKNSTVPRTIRSWRRASRRCRRPMRLAQFFDRDAPAEDGQGRHGRLPAVPGAARRSGRDPCAAEADAPAVYPVI